MRYGVPYTGSKNGIAKWVIDNLPRAKNLVDVFAGGCAITHAALLSGKYENFIANDLSPAPQLFLDAIHGKYRDEKRWISREDFFRMKDSDAYVKYCWSFGNNGEAYLYGQKIEPYKKALHYAVVLDEWDEMKRLCPEVADACREHLLGMTDMKKRRIEIGKPLVQWLKKCGTVEVYENNPLYSSCRVKTINKTRQPGTVTGDRLLQRLERLESLQSLESLESLQSLAVTKSDYRRILIPQDAVIYCDPPYVGTANKYGNFIDYEEFYRWCECQENLVVISEYTMPEDRFVRVAMKEKRQLFSSTANDKIKEEGLYVPRAQEDLYWMMMYGDPVNEFYQGRRKQNDNQ